MERPDQKSRSENSMFHEDLSLSLSLYQHPTGHQLRPVTAQQPSRVSRGDLLEGAGISIIMCCLRCVGLFRSMVLSLSLWNHCLPAIVVTCGLPGCPGIALDFLFAKRLQDGSGFIGFIDRCVTAFLPGRPIHWSVREV